MPIIVCPFCNKGLRNSDSRCPGCNKPFRFKDWPVAEAYSPVGLFPRLTIKWADNSWSPAAFEFAVGRSPDQNGLTLDDPTVSKNHVRIYLDGSEWKISRLKPDNKLKINSKSAEDGSVIFSGDQIELGISAPLEAVVEYVQKNSVNTVNCVLGSTCFEKLTPAEPLRIGSDSNVCKIVIKNADKCNSIIYFRSASQSWWIVDCSSEGRTKLNGEPIRNAELFDDDKISIGGVDFVFKSETLIPLSPEKQGLALRLENISASASPGHFLLHDLDLDIKPGEFVGILGPSGCGKSSLIQRLAGLGSFCRGKVTVNGNAYNSKEKIIKSLTAYVPQDVALHNDLTLDEEIKSFCLLHIKLSEITEEKISTVLRLVQLSSERNKRIGDLSGGQKRRVMIMLELLRNPQLFLLDEPTAGLDPATETDIMLYLRRIANQGKTVLCSTHILGNLRLFDKILLLSCGEMVFWGTPSELLNYFQADSMLELYRLFGNGTKEEQQDIAKRYASGYKSSTFYKKYNKYNSSPKCSAELPVAKQKSSAFQQIFGYLYRQLLEFTSFRHSKIKDFFFSAALIQSVIQPILIALVLKLACASYFFTAGAAGNKEIFFFSAIAVFWLGLNTAIRELVKERTPWRCLERLECINLISYLSGKVLWTILTSLVQVSVFALILYMIPAFDTEKISVDFEINGVVPELNFIFSWVFFFVLLSVCLTGAWIGLAISAFFKKETPAVGLLPIILIPVLFFSQPIIKDLQFGNYPLHPVEHVHDEKNSSREKCEECIRRQKEEEKCDDGNYNGFALTVKRIMPCHEPQVYMDMYHNVISQKDQEYVTAADEKNVIPAFFRMLRNTLCYMIVSLFLMIVFQYRNEKKWEGR